MTWYCTVIFPDIDWENGSGGANVKAYLDGLSLTTVNACSVAPIGKGAVLIVVEGS